jgi:gluconolactonase
MAPTADQAFMHLLVSASHTTWQARISQDHKLEHRQQHGYLHVPYLSRSSGASGVAVDSEGRYYVTSAAGIQVLDQLGRVHFMLAPPPEGVANGLAFGGARRDTLYVTTGKSVYRRSLKAKGLATFEAPVEPPKPGL